MEYQKLASDSSDFDYQHLSTQLKEYNKLIKAHNKASGTSRRDLSQRISQLHSSLKETFKRPRITKDAKAKLLPLETQFTELTALFNRNRGAEEEEMKASVLSQEKEEDLEDLGIRERVSLAYKDSTELRKEELLERKEKIEELHKDFVTVNEMFKDASKMIHQDGEMLTQAEHHVDVAVAETNRGVNELGKAEGYQKKARNKMCWIFVIVLIVVGVLIAIILGVVVF